MDTIANIDKNVESIVDTISTMDSTNTSSLTLLNNISTQLDTLDVNNTDIITALNSILSELSNLDINTTPIVDPLETVFNQTVTANSTNTTNAIDTSLVKKLWIFCSNTTSTSLTILVNALSASNSSDDVTLAPMTLDTTTINGGCYITDLPPYVRFKIINNDASYTSDVTIKIIKTR